MTVRDIPMF